MTRSVDDWLPNRPNVGVKRDPLDAEIRPRIDAFVAELATLVRLAAVQAVVEALEGGTGKAKPAAPARSPRAGTKARAVVATGGSSAPAGRATRPAGVPSLDDYERAAIQRALVDADGSMVGAGKLLGRCKTQIYRRARFLDVSNRGVLARPGLGSNLPLDLDAYERAAIDGALDACGRDKAAAAKLLGMGKSTMYRRMGVLGIAR
jgi:DNA-binding NtrC family response regulator